MVLGSIFTVGWFATLLLLHDVQEKLYWAAPADWHRNGEYQQVRDSLRRRRWILRYLVPAASWLVIVSTVVFYLRQRVGNDVAVAVLAITGAGTVVALLRAQRDASRAFRASNELSIPAPPRRAVLLHTSLLTLGTALLALAAYAFSLDGSLHY